MPSKIVVAGVTSLYMSVGVEEFPLDYAPSRKPAWMRADVAGAAGHIAKVLHTLGDEVRLCTMTGSDPVSLAVRTDLGRRGLLGPGVVDGGACSLGVVLVAPDGRRMGFPYLAAVSAIEYPVEVFQREADGADLAVLTNARFVRPLVRHAERLGMPIAVDVHLISDIEDDYNRPWLEVADIVFCSHERLPCAPAAWVAQVFARYPGCVIAGVGRGQDGCLLGLRDGTLVQVAGLAPRGVVSTAGAGDALFASFLHGWLATANPVRALENAVLHAGWKVGDSLPASASLTEAGLAELRDLHRVKTSVGRWDAGPGVTPGQDRRAEPVAHEPVRGSASPGRSQG
jgi:sugar/nucleoside kinase (ribokinase family)